MVYIRSDIPSRRITDYEANSVELLVLEVLPKHRHNKRQTKWLFLNAYKRPKISNGLFTTEITNMLDNVHASYSNICIVGDLNLNWMVKSKCEPINNLCDQYAYEQLIKQPTNLTIQNESLIYVIMCSDPSVCPKSGPKNTGLSDSHNMVYVVMKIRVDRLPARTVTYRSYKHFNEDMYPEDISRIPASICEVFDDPSDNYWMLQPMINEIMDEHAPKKTMKVRAKETPFMNGDLRSSIRMKTPI